MMLDFKQPIFQNGIKRLVKYIFTLIALTANVCLLHAITNRPEYGIHIQTYPHQPTEFTTIALDNDQPIEIGKKDLRLEMDIWAYPINPLGSICRVLSDNGSHVDLMYSVGDDSADRYPMLVLGDKDVMQSTPIQCGEWVHVAITMSPTSGKVTIDYDGEVSEAVYDEFKGTRSVRINVGLCRLPDFLLFDVASIAVKDVSIYRGSKEIRHWKMERHAGNVCYDEIAQAPATVDNAHWIIDEAVTWKKIHTAEFPYFPSVAFDPRVATFYLAYRGDPSLYIYHATEGATDTIITKGGEYAAIYPNQLIYITQFHQLLSYNLDEDIFSAFDPISHCWESNRKSTKEHGYWNNTIVYNPADSALVSFGGYGFYHYNNTLLRSYPYSDKPQRAVTLDSINPRYACSSALVDSILYIFGGRGCPSGRQELSPRNYYDMYAVNLNNDRVTKLWGDNTQPLPGGQDFIVGENMIYNRDENCMYIWGTLNGGTLFRVDMATGRFEEVSLPMSASLKAQTLYCNLYYSAPQKSFYSVMINSDVNGASTVNIYQLDYPPVPVASLALDPITPRKNESSSATKIVIILVSLLAIALAATLYIMARRRHNDDEDTAEHLNTPAPCDLPDTTTAAEPDDTPSPAQTPTAETEAVRTDERTETVPARPHYDLTTSSIRFLGGFRVFDSNSQDITPQFTPTLKQLLILLVLYTGKNPMGIPNNKLLSILWGDKEEEAAKNTRNVYMSRLRNLLSQIGNVTIQTHNGFRNISFGPGTTCDYLEALRLFSESDNSTDGENIDRLLELLFNGVMLPNVELDYVDNFKSSFSNDTLDLLSGLIQKPELSNSLKLKIADTLFQHDFINEDALRIKCQILHAQGRTGVAQTVYKSFCKEYKSIVGSDYPVSLTDIINNN